MILEEAKSLLAENKILYELQEYRDEKEYLHHVMCFPYTRNAKSCKVMAMVIRSKNGEKDIELQFNEFNGVFYFEDLFFGEFCFELFDVVEESLAENLISIIRDAKEGRLAIIVANNLKKRCWQGDACFDLSDPDEDFGQKGYRQIIQRIQSPRGFLKKMFKSKLQYEIYDWNTYQCITK